MPRPRLTIIQGGGEPAPVADEYERVLQRIEDAMDNLLETLDLESPKYTNRSWRTKPKWRP